MHTRHTRRRTNHIYFCRRGRHFHFIFFSGVSVVNLIANTMTAHTHTYTCWRGVGRGNWYRYPCTPVCAIYKNITHFSPHLCVQYFIFICLPFWPHTHTHAHTGAATPPACNSYQLSGWGEKEKGLSRRSADRRRRRGRADVLNFIDKFNVSVTFRYATSAYSVCGARSIVRSDSYRRSLYPYRSSKCLSLVLLLVLLLCYGQRIPWAKGIQTVILWQ